MSLAIDFRPKNIDDIVGQKDVVFAFKKFITNEKIPHSLFFGPAGSGKTTLAKAIANEMNYDFFELDASNLKVEDIRRILAKYDGGLTLPLIFIDEFHRLSKTQQEILLIPMENYKALIIGATTENPQFVVSSGIRSRSLLFEFKPLDSKDLLELFKKINKKMDFKISKDAKDYLIQSSGGDARSFLNLLDYALLIDKNIKLDVLKILRANSISEGVSNKNSHYDLASAMIKSLRGSDVDASIYYLARLINAGESADFIARRLIVFASEDIGNANPNALNLATNTLLAVSKIGFPEARILLAQCVIYLASSPKSNSSYNAINKALDYVKNNKPLEIPKYLINTNPEKKDYLYPHDFNGYVKQRYLEKDLFFYESKKIGFEKTLDEWIKKIKSEN